MNDKKIEKLWEQIIIELGYSLKDENFRETPRRISKLYNEIFSNKGSKIKVEMLLKKSFPTNYKGMVIETDIKCYSMCPHHFLPVIYTVHIGYVPNKRGLGLSKLPRLIKLLAKAPKLQEDFTEEIVDIINKTIKTKGCICVVRGEHLCMQARGVEQRECITTTSGVRGIFEKNKDGVKDEFMSLIKL